MNQRMVILGAGTALPDRERDNTFMVWDSPTGSLLIDCGGRAYQQLLRADVDPKGVRAILLTHSHPDHIYGLPAFLFHLWLAGYACTLDVYANVSTLRMARGLCEALELAESGWMCATNWHTLPETPEQLVTANAAYSVYTTPVRHTRPTLAIKIVDHEVGQSLVYSADTSPCPELEQLAQGAHTLIHEASTADPNEGYGHTTPRQAAEIAIRCAVEQLVLIHFSADYVMPEAQAFAEVREAGYLGAVSIARELDVFTTADIETIPEAVLVAEP